VTGIATVPEPRCAGVGGGGGGPPALQTSYLSMTKGAHRDTVFF
jgi:hypothetical protein